MKSFYRACLVLLAGALCFANLARASSIASSPSDSVVESSKGASESIRVSSNSSADNEPTAAVRDGAYRVAAIQADDAGQGLWLTLEPVAADVNARSFELLVPHVAFAGQTPTQGERLHARYRAYGLQFARGQAQEPFFIVLAKVQEKSVAARPLAS